MNTVDVLKSLIGETIVEVKYGEVNTKEECITQGIALKLSSGRVVVLKEHQWAESDEWGQWDSAAGVKAVEVPEKRPDICFDDFNSL